MKSLLLPSPVAASEEVDLTAIHGASVRLTKLVNQALKGWQDNLRPTDKVSLDNPVQSFYNLAATRSGVSISKMSTATAQVLEELFGVVQTPEQKRALAAFLNDMLAGIKGRSANRRSS